jgi:hypothetical protein
MLGKLLEPTCGYRGPAVLAMFCGIVNIQEL